MKKDDAMPARRGYGPPGKEQKRQQGRRRLLAEWRGTDEPEDLSKWEKPIASVVQKVLQRAGLEDRLNHEEVAAHWSAVVGDFLSKHSRPVALRRAILHIAVTQPAVRYDMERRLKSDILIKLKARFPAGIRGLKFENG
jgi:predicted nucleic acid-binding Zn ribbon protein